jgi:acetylornithine deacetylase/succinyl-diaminopimelate desuccinylase-like protein
MRNEPSCKRALLLPMIASILLVLSQHQGQGQRPDSRAWPVTPAQDLKLAREIFQQLIEIDTTHSIGSVTEAAEAMRARLLQAGFAPEDLALAGPSQRKQNLIVRFHGEGRQAAIAIMAHLDVVEAKRSDWTVDPFKFLERDGYYYGRGTQDIKDNVAIAVETLIRLKREGYRPSGDLLLLLSADEEDGPDDGMAWLVRERPELFRNLLFAMNLDAGDFNLKNGQPSSLGYEAAEKTYADFEITANDAGGHSSLPHPGNPIQRISDGLARLEAAPFSFELNPITREFFAETSNEYDPPTRRLVQAALAAPENQQALGALAANSTSSNALLRTTCVPTHIEGGHANNALPNSASANINCRILPGHSPAEVEEHIVQALGDNSIAVHYCGFGGGCGIAPTSIGFPPVTPSPAMLHSLQEVSAELWGNIPVVPEMETGASDSVYTMAAGVRTYGISGTGIDEDDVRAHGKDERLRVKSFDEGLEFFYLLVRSVTATALPAQR